MSRTTTTRHLTALAAATAMALTTSCAAAPADTATAPGHDTRSASPAGPDGTSGEARNARNLVLSDVRVADRADGDRVVLRFTGRGAPGWVSQYVERARADGSGKRIRLAGDSVLDVYARPTTWSPDASYDGPRRPRVPGDGPIAGVYVVGFLEGDTQVLVGVDGERAPYRVSARSNPPRLVVDVWD